jgi:uncharacterized protein YneF (UPF0154 family)
MEALRKTFALTLIGLLVGVLIGFLFSRGRMNRQLADSQTLFDRKIRCQQIAQQLQREQAKEYDYLQYEDIEYSSKRNSCVASVTAFRGSLELYLVEDLVSRTTLWTGTCTSGVDCDREAAIRQAREEQRAKF